MVKVKPVKRVCRRNQQSIEPGYAKSPIAEAMFMSILLNQQKELTEIEKAQAT